MTKKQKLVVIAIIAVFFIVVLFFRSHDGGKGLGPCEKIAKKMTAAIEDMNECKTAADCVLLNGCPYGCNNLINKNADMKDFAELRSEYRDTCGTCESACMRALRPEEIACEKGRCVSTRP